MKKNYLFQIVGIVFWIFAVCLTVPRFFVFPSLCSRAYECASIHRAVGGPFRSDFLSEKPRICGDLSSLANEPTFCEPRSERFVTDPWGYRNERDIWQAEPRTIIFGDSFSLGQGVTQSDIPAEQLTRQVGEKIYNGGGRIELEYLGWIVKHRKTPIKSLVFLFLERWLREPKDLENFTKIHDETSLFEQSAVILEDLKHYNPLQILAARLDKQFLIPAVFPNRFREAYPTFYLKNGRAMLFFPDSVTKYSWTRANEITEIVKYFVGLKEILRAKDIALHVVLIPEKYSVYARLLDHPVVIPPAENRFLNLLNHSLQNKNVDTLNLLPLFEREAEERLHSGNLIYWADDTHWNAQGIALMAQALASHLKSLKE